MFSKTEASAFFAEICTYPIIVLIYSTAHYLRIIGRRPANAKSLKHSVHLNMNVEKLGARVMTTCYNFQHFQPCFHR